MTSKRPLTAEEKETIRKAIMDNMSPDDRYPYQVIDEQFGGDEDEYLRAMANWHHIPIGSGEE